MGTIVGLQIIEQVARDLLDPDHERWTLEDLVGYLNAAQREIAILRPDASVSVRALPLTVSQTRQTLPEDGVRLLEIVRNMGVDGATPGAPVRVVDRDELDAVRPNWHSETATATAVQAFCVDGRVPTTFYVYPKLRAAAYVEAQFQCVPTEVQVSGVSGATANTVIALSDLYQTPMIDYMMMRAKAKDTDGQSTQESELAYRRFLNRLGLKLQADKAFDPNRNSPPRETKRGPDDVRPAF
jgi:hypothetical protein